MTDTNWNWVRFEPMSLTFQMSTLTTRPLGPFIPSHCSQHTRVTGSVLHTVDIFEGKHPLSDVTGSPKCYYHFKKQFFFSQTHVWLRKPGTRWGTNPHISQSKQEQWLGINGSSGLKVKALTWILKKYLAKVETLHQSPARRVDTKETLVTKTVADAAPWSMSGDMKVINIPYQRLNHLSTY